MIVKFKRNDGIVTYSVNNSLLGLLFVIFLVLKLAGVGAVASWSWWWVTAPLWMPAILFLAVFFLVFLIGLIGKLL
jgi:Flp pilus assembly protein protease CpaA